MVIKQGILKEEIALVKDFLSKFNLTYREDTEFTLYAEENDEIVGTCSCIGNIIAELAVKKELQGENVAILLLNAIISHLRENHIFGYRVFTKPIYKQLFLSLGFNLLIESDEFISLEGGSACLTDEVNKLKSQIDLYFGGHSEDKGAIVLNGNPFTQGHLSLLEYALQKHDKVVLFVLEEDKSEFTFKERFSLAYLSTRQYAERVVVVPSTNYIVSRSTFPDYFLKSVDEGTRAFAKYDASIFKEYFMPALGIEKRYVGSESQDYMKIYNESLKNVLGEKVEIIDRYKIDGIEVSAKTVRQLLKEKQFDKACELVPLATRSTFLMIAKGKYDK